jgi:hypothetical protein
VLGERVAQAVAAAKESGDPESGWRAAEVAVPGEPVPAVPIAPRAVVQRAMTAAAGIGRDAAGLAAASDVVEAASVLGVPVDRAGVEDAALTLLAQAVLAAAGTRTESRGCHVRTDFPSATSCGSARATTYASTARADRSSRRGPGWVWRDRARSGRCPGRRSRWGVAGGRVRRPVGAERAGAGVVPGRRRRRCAGEDAR